MKTKSPQKVITAAAVLALIVTTMTASAQKMKTDIPESITTPDAVETRLGTLKFRDGFPDDATVQKVYDNLDFQRGVQAFLTGIPGANLVGMRKGLRELGAVNGTLAIAETLLDSKALWLTPNTDTVYAVSWIDLKNGPVVIESPPMPSVSSMTSGSTTSPTWAWWVLTRVRGANFSFFRLGTRTKCRRDTTCSSRRPSATGTCHAGS